MENKKLQNQIDYLKVYATVSTVLILILLVFRIADTKNQTTNSESKKADSLSIKFLSVERLDVVEPSGELGISLSNSKHTPLPSWGGKELQGASNRNSSNIIFFDGKGDEVGGINFSNNHENGEAVRHLAFDGYKQDEVMAFSHFIQNGKSRTGLYIYDRPDLNILNALEEMDIQPEDNEAQLSEKLKLFKKNSPERFSQIWYDTKRVALQTNNDEQAEMILADGNGQVRLRLMVSEQGNAFIEFLDQDGNVTKQIKGDD